MSGEIERFEDGSVAIPVLAEELVLTRSRRVRERLIVRRKVEQREERVDADLRREHVDVGSVGDVVLDPEGARASTRLAPPDGTVVTAALTKDDIAQLRNLPVVTLDAVEVGRVGDVWYDDATGNVHAVSVAGDVLGFRRVELPATGAVLRPDALQLAYTRAELDAIGRPEASAEIAIPDEAAGVVRHEEELEVALRPVNAGAVRAHKRVESDHVREVYHREVEHFDTVDRVAVGGDDDGRILTLDDGSISIPLFEEVVEVAKRAVVRERVLIEKHAEVDTYEVSARLRRERVDADVD